MTSNGRDELLEVLREARAWLALPDNDFNWSRWESAGQALAELDAFIAQIEGGQGIEGMRLQMLFGPTGNIQEVSLSSGWGTEFLPVALRFDAAIARYGSR